ncbi:MAG: hypothetical protein L7H00_03745 [Vulcanisaeta sp.]|nr:hypothetical protein [Vulcanisaeta sp.]
MVKVHGRVYDGAEFARWFMRQVSREMGCHDVDVVSIGVFPGEVVIAFYCDGKRYLAKIREGRKFKVSTYQFIYENGRLVGLEPFRMREGESFVLRKQSEFSASVLFYVEDGVNIDVYETRPRGGLLRPRDY